MNSPELLSSLEDVLSEDSFTTYLHPHNELKPKILAACFTRLQEIKLVFYLFIFLHLPKTFQEICGQGYLWSLQPHPQCVCLCRGALVAWCSLLHISSLRGSCLSSLGGAEGFRNMLSIHLDLIELLPRIDCRCVPTKLLVALARSSQIGATFKWERSSILPL